MIKPGWVSFQEFSIGLGCVTKALVISAVVGPLEIQAVSYLKQIEVATPLPVNTVRAGFPTGFDKELKYLLGRIPGRKQTKKGGTCYFERHSEVRV